MQTENTAFLIACGQDGSILRPYWCQPVYLLSPYHKKITDLFSTADAPSLNATIRKALNQKELFFCSERLELVCSACRLSVCMIAAGNSLLIHGFDASVIKDPADVPVLKALAHQFMQSIASFEEEFASGSEEMVRLQFEQIQKLNNTLLNTERELKKANAKLNQVNADLNNRLVKDALTGLVSRYQYRTEIDMLIRNMPEKLGIFAFIDIDDFKKINDRHGHHSGDIYLQTFAERLMRLPYPNGIFMRISGDEFGVYIHGFDKVEAQDIEAVWDNIEEIVLKEPVDVGGTLAAIACSAGMAVYGKDTREIYELIEYADFAMYQAKNSGKHGYRVFDPKAYLVKNDTN